MQEYHRCHLEYLRYVEARSQQTTVVKAPDLRAFSKPQREGKNLNGYDGTSITDDFVTDVYARFAAERQKECDKHLRTLTGEAHCAAIGKAPKSLRFSIVATTLSLDATFRSASKASFVNDDNTRSSIFNGGLHTAINQKAMVVAYVSILWPSVVPC